MNVNQSFQRKGFIVCPRLPLDRFDETNHRSFLVSVLNDWLRKNRHVLDIPNQQLVENEDFQFSFVVSGGAEQVVLSCLCGVKFHLPKSGQRYSLSNYYKHIKTTSCIMMKKKRAAEQNVTDPSSSTSPSAHRDEEQSENEPVVQRIPSSNSSIIVARTTNMESLTKRSQDSDKQISSKRKRILE